MKSKRLLWILAICIVGVTTALSQQRGTRPDGAQTRDNLAQDVILVPVDDPLLPNLSLQVGGPFRINAAFDNNVTAQQRAVIMQAINEWTAIIRTSGVTPGNYLITFSNGALTESTLALTTTTFSKNSGNLISATIVIDNRGTTAWYVDLNPADDVEFNGTPPAGPPAGIDLLTVMRHELGHALGWTDTKRVTGLLSGNDFDPTRFNIATVGGDGGRHSDPGIHAGDIMNPALAPSTRHSIALYPAATMIARAFAYDITMSFVDNAYLGDETGSANQPWNTVREGGDWAPFGQLLLTPKTFDEMTPFRLSRPMIITVVRGGGALIK